MRKMRYLVACCLLALILAACGQQSAPKAAQGSQAGSGSGQAAQAPAAQAPAAQAPAVPAKKDKVAVAYSSVSASQVIPLVAKEAGIFDKYGIDADITFISGSTKLAQALVAGDIGFAITGGQAVIEAAVAGADTVMIGGTVYTLLFSVVTQPDIKSPQDLKGKTIGVTRVGTSSDFAARYALKKWGFDPDKDVKTLQLNDMPGILAGLKTGQIQAGILSSPTDLQAQGFGLNKMAFLGDLGLVYQQTGVSTTRKFIQKNPDLVKRFMQAYIEALWKFKTDKAFAIKTIGELTKTEDQKVLEQTYSIYEPLMAKVPLPSIPGMQTILDELSQSNPKAASVKPENLVDTSFVKGLDDSGFIKKLYGDK